MPLLNNEFHRLAGIRPTGRMHLGHYFSVIKPALDFGAKVLIAEYHAPQYDVDDASAMVSTMRSFGIDSENIRFQSETFDAAFYFELLSIARVGELQRMTQYMTAGDDNDAHLLVYPVLMVHDVAGYDEILVGDDQTQHINYARDLLGRYNRLFNKSFRLPVARPVGGRVMSLTDPSKKMSKSEPEGCLFLDDSPTEVERKIKAAVMDEAGYANLIQLYRNLGGFEEIPEMNSEFKPMVATAINRVLSNVHEEA